MGHFSSPLFFFSAFLPPSPSSDESYVSSFNFRLTRLHTSLRLQFFFSWCSTHLNYYLPSAPCKNTGPISVVTARFIPSPPVRRTPKYLHGRPLPRLLCPLFPGVVWLKYILLVCSYLFQISAWEILRDSFNDPPLLPPSLFFLSPTQVFFLLCCLVRLLFSDSPPEFPPRRMIHPTITLPPLSR